MTLGLFGFRDPYASLAGMDPRFSAFPGYAQGLQAGLALSQSPFAPGSDQGLDRALAQFFLGAALQGGNGQINPALAFALQSALQQANLGMSPGGAFSPQQQAMQDLQLLVSMVAMAMMLGQAMNGCGCRSQGQMPSGQWGGGRPVDRGDWGKPGPGYDPRGTPIPPSGEMPRGSGTGNRLAQAAFASARRRGTVGRCYAGVKEAVRNATGVQLHGGSAYMAADQLSRSSQFREVRVGPDQLRNLPPGAIVVWGRTARSPHGHISVSLGDGREASDHIQRQMTSLRGAQNYRVFVPADSVGGDRQNMIAGNQNLGTGRTHQARGTGYYPDSSPMEGGYVDRRGRPLHTLQDYLAGRAPYVSVAMDSNAAPYGTRVRIPELEQRYGRPIDFRVVDTGGAFRGRGMNRIDICTANRRASLDATINGPLTLVF